MTRSLRRHIVVTGIIAIFALAGGVLLIPRQDEYVAMLARDGRYEEAWRMLLSMRGMGDRRPQVLMQMLVLRIKLGDIPGALEATEAVLAVRPGDRGAQEIMADLLLQSGRLDEYLRVTERLVRSHPDPDRLSRLLALYRHHGRYDAELGLLQTFAGGPHLSLPDYERLGALLSARGDWEGAERWLRVVDRQAPAGETSARLRLLHVLLRSGRVEEAQRLGEKWLTKWQNPYLAGRLIIRLAQAGAARSAVALARVCAERMPEAALQVAGVLTESAHSEIARELLARWVDLASEPSADAARSYVHVSLAAGEWRKPLEKLLQLVRTGASPEIQAGFAEEIAYGYGPEMLAQLMPLLPRAALRARPLLAAQIMRLGENGHLAEWYLDRVDPSRLAGHQQKVWLALLRALKPAPVVLQRLIKLRESGRMPPELAHILADEAKVEGISELHGAVWARGGG
jgi:tetratricopeptide (TPR) repeat protein